MHLSAEFYQSMENASHPMGWGASLKGKRALNEDSFLIDRGLGIYAVADGIGGEEGGEVASHLVIEALAAFFHEHEAHGDEGETLILRLAIASAHDRLLAQAVGPLSRMGTTLAVLQIQTHHVLIAHVGDSRIYRLRDGELTLLTRDHSVGERFPAHVGPRHRARSLTQALAPEIDGTPDIFVLDREPEDLYLLCSDGVSEPLAHEQLTSLLKKTAPSLCAIRAVARAIGSGGRDNATAVVVYDDEIRSSALHHLATRVDRSVYQTRRG